MMTIEPEDTPLGLAGTGLRDIRPDDEDDEDDELVTPMFPGEQQTVDRISVSSVSRMAGDKVTVAVAYNERLWERWVLSCFGHKIETIVLKTPSTFLAYIVHYFSDSGNNHEQLSVLPTDPVKLVFPRTSTPQPVPPSTESDEDDDNDKDNEPTKSESCKLTEGATTAVIRYDPAQDAAVQAYVKASDGLQKRGFQFAAKVAYYDGEMIAVTYIRTGSAGTGSGVLTESAPTSWVNAINEIIDDEDEDETGLTLIQMDGILYGAQSTIKEIHAKGGTWVQAAALHNQLAQDRLSADLFALKAKQSSRREALFTKFSQPTEMTNE